MAIKGPQLLVEKMGIYNRAIEGFLAFSVEVRREDKMKRGVA